MSRITAHVLARAMAEPVTYQTAEHVSPANPDQEHAMTTNHNETTFNRGDRVRVRHDAPHHAGQTSTIADSHTIDGTPGYLLLIGASLEWVPAEALESVDDTDRNIR